MPVAPQILRHAAERPHAVALRGPASRLTYGELAVRVQGGARALLSGRRDDRTTRRPGHEGVLALSLADPVELIVAVLAADLAGVTPLLCDPAWGRDRRDRMLAAIPVDGCRDTPLPVLPGPPVVPRPAPGDRVWACFGSGSTGRPRAVVRTRASWTRSFPHLDRMAGLTADDTVLVPGPLTASLYGFAATHALALGATVLTPGRWQPTALAKHLGGATVAHLVPHTLPAVLAAKGAGPLRTVLVGGAALPPGSRARAERSGLRVLAYYGATELSFVAADLDGSGLRAFPEVEIDVRGWPLGEVWVRSPWLSAGYLAGAAGPLRVDEHGWMSVGDLAEPYDGVLRVRGRGDGAIQTGGATVLPEDVETVLRAVPGVRDAVVVGAPHPALGSVVTAVIETPPAAARTMLDLAARSGLDPAQRPRHWYGIAELPRTAAGKPARGRIIAMLSDGDPALRRLR